MTATPRLSQTTLAEIEALATARDSSEDAGSAGEDVSGVIHGVAIDEVGEPVAGASVTATLYRKGPGFRAISTSDSGRAWDGGEDLSERLRKSAESAALTKRRLRTTTADEKGAFTLSGLAPGRHSVDAYAEGLKFRSQTVRVGSRVTLRGQRLQGFLLEVVDEAGTPVPEAVIRVSTNRRRGQLYAWSATEPELRLGDRSAVFEAFVGHVEELRDDQIFAERASESRRITLDLDGVGPHRFTVKSRPSLIVEVEDKTSDGPSPAPRVSFISEARLMESGGREAFARRARNLGASDDGLFRATGLKEGVYLVGAGRGSREPEVIQEVTVTSAPTSMSLELAPLTTERFLVATIQDAAGRRRTGASFQLVYEKDAKPETDRLSATERQIGEFWIPWDRDADHWGGPVRLVVTTPGAGTKTLPMTRDSERVTVTLQQPAELVVDVIGDPDHLYSVEAAMMGPLGGTGKTVVERRPSLLTRGQGSVTFDALQPGVAQLSVRRARDESNRWSVEQTLATREVNIQGGTQRVSLSVAELHSLSIYAPGEPQSTSFYLSPDPGNELRKSGSGRTSADKKVTITDLPAGRYSLTARDAPPIEVTVPGGVVTYERPSTAGFRVSVSRRGRDLAPFEKGDLVIEVDGESVAVGDVRDRIDIGAAKGGARVHVIRRGEEIELKVTERPRYARFKPVATLE